MFKSWESGNIELALLRLSKKEGEIRFRNSCVQVHHVTSFLFFPSVGNVKRQSGIISHVGFCRNLVRVLHVFTLWRFVKVILVQGVCFLDKSFKQRARERKRERNLHSLEGIEAAQRSRLLPYKHIIYTRTSSKTFLFRLQSFTRYRRSML